MRRLYFLMPDITSTHNLVNELLLSHVEERHIHVIAKEGTPMEELPEASFLQSSDFVPAIERGLTLGAITGVLCGLVAMTLPPAGLVIGGGAVFANKRQVSLQDIPYFHCLSRYVRRDVLMLFKQNQMRTLSASSFGGISNRVYSRQTPGHRSRFIRTSVGIRRTQPLPGAGPESQYHTVPLSG